MSAQLDGLMGLLSGAFRRGSPIPEDAGLSAVCAEHVTGNDRLSPAEQVDIYRRQFWLRHVDALRDDYPGLAFVLGDDLFEAFCRAYLAACPPTSPTLRDLGSDIVRFAQTYDGFPEGKAALARDMVRYENAFVDLFDGADPPPLDPAKVQGMPEDGWATARIVLHPLLVRMRLDHPVHRVRAALRDTRPDGADGEVGAELPVPRPVHLALFRKDLVIRYEELDPLAFALLDALAQGTPLVPACEEISMGLDDEAGAALAGSVQAWFAQWTAWGFLVDVLP